MNTIEDRIRAAAHAAADTVPPDGVPPLRLPLERVRPRPRPAGRTRAAWGWASRRRDDRGWTGAGQARWTRLLAPAAAAVAVVVVILAAVGIGQARHPAGGAAPGTAGPGPLVAGPPVSSYVASGQVPPYYLVIAPEGNQNLAPSDAVVHATTSGKTVATIRPSAVGSTIVAVSAAADDRTFVLAEQAWAAGSGAVWQRTISFYLVRLSTAGQSGRPARLAVSVPAGARMTGLALSPDGRELAIGVQPAHGKQQPYLQQVKVYDLRVGTARTWSGYGSLGVAYDTRSLSWPASQRTLAFDWVAGQSPSQSGTVRLLSLDTSGGNLITSSRLATSLGSQAQRPAGALPVCLGNSIVTPDGSVIVCAANQILRTSVSGPPKAGATGFAEFSTATGRLARILGYWTSDGSAVPQVMNVAWSAPSGRVLIGDILLAGRQQVGVIRGNQFTPLHDPVNVAAPDFGTW